MSNNPRNEDVLDQVRTALTRYAKHPGGICNSTMVRTTCTCSDHDHTPMVCNCGLGDIRERLGMERGSNR